MNQSRSKVALKAKFPAGLGEKNRLSRSKLKHAFVIDSHAELFMYLILNQWLGSAHEKCGV